MTKSYAIKLSWNKSSGWNHCHDSQNMEHSEESSNVSNPRKPVPAGRQSDLPPEPHPVGVVQHIGFFHRTGQPFRVGVGRGQRLLEISSWDSSAAISR